MNNSDLDFILDGLNPQQQIAVEHGDGPLLILAGAGSGKTKTLTHRIAYLVSNRGLSPHEILAVTFTNKAAGEMRERLAKLLNQSADNRSFMPWMGTFHSISVRILRQFGEQIKIPGNFVILDESDRLSLVKAAMRELHIVEKQFSPRTIASLISSAKNDCMTPDDYFKVAKMPLQQVAAEVYPRYERLRRDGKALDFDDLLLETVRLLNSVPQVKQRLQEKFKSILIDEYQDTNAAQYKIVRALVGPDRNICVVGDDWQSIYSWRGADFTNILNFERDFPGAKIVKLEQNYRSTKAILNAAHNVIVKNQHRTDKALWSDGAEGKPVQILQTGSETDEAETVARSIAAEFRVGARNYKDFAVLYRTNAQSRVLEEAFLRFGLPYKIVGGTRFYDRSEVKDLLAYLKIIYQPFDRSSFQRIVNVPRRSLGDTSVTRFMEWQASRGLSIVDGLLNVASCDTLTSRARNAFLKLGQNLQGLAEAAKTTPPDVLLEKIIDLFDYRDYLNDGSLSAESRLENVSELVGFAKTYADIGLTGFLEEVALVSSADVAVGDDAVVLMTLHAAKGLEFPVVFIVGMEDGIFPGARAEFDPAAMEEERRLCYVGMTRAREELILTFARSRLLYGSRQYNAPSRFLSDIDSDIMDQLGRSNFGFQSGNFLQETDSFSGGFGANTEPEYIPDEVDLSIGDKVEHQIFGVGTVDSIDGQIVAVNFGLGRVKKLNVGFAPLKRL